MQLSSLPPVQAVTDCRGERHLIRWEAGNLLTPDHDDIEGERALGALGGHTAGCVSVIDAWDRLAHTTDPLVLLPRSHPDLAARSQSITRPRYQSAQRKSARSSVGSGGVSAQMVLRSGGGAGPAPTLRVADAQRFVALGPAIARRLVATATANTLAGPTTEAAPALHASLFGRAGASLRQWAGTDTTMDLEVTTPDEPRSLEPLADDRFQLHLPWTWVIDVWGSTLDVLDGHFTLDATEDGPHRLRLTMIDPALNVHHLSIHRGEL